MQTIVRYINEAFEELHQVRWPTRQQAMRLSLVVIGFTAACAVFFGAIDFVLSFGLQKLLSLV